jgi:hypothetical protein
MLSVPISQAGLSDLRGAAEKLPPVAPNQFVKSLFF